MTGEYKGEERRAFPRYDFEKPVEYRALEASEDRRFLSAAIRGMVKNVSASGILFIVDALSVPKIASLLLLELEYQTSVVCKEIEERSLIARNRFLGKVVRVANNDDGTCDVGVALIPRHDPLPEGVRMLIE
jgi:hypothetical protein